MYYTPCDTCPVTRTSRRMRNERLPARASNLGTMRSAPGLGCRFLRCPISLAGLLAIGVLAPLLLPRPTYATSGTTRLPERPCPDLSQNLSYGRAGGSAVPDGRGGAFVAWADDREVSVMRFDPEGRSAPRWP